MTESTALIDIHQRLKQDPVYQALEDVRRAQWASYQVVYKRCEQKLKRLERARLKAKLEIHAAEQAHTDAIYACNDYYNACKRQQP